ncbi:hypothetical protein D3C86_2036100 [compost metagenome]
MIRTIAAKAVILVNQYSLKLPLWLLGIGYHSLKVCPFIGFGRTCFIQVLLDNIPAMVSSILQ